MFFILNRKKISSYLILMGTVAILFSFAIFNTNSGQDNILQTGAEPTITKRENNINEIKEQKDNLNGINYIKNVENIDSLN